jgi:hypothetical protein
MKGEVFNQHGYESDVFLWLDSVAGVQVVVD